MNPIQKKHDCVLLMLSSVSKGHASIFQEIQKNGSAVLGIFRLVHTFCLCADQTSGSHYPRRVIYHGGCPDGLTAAFLLLCAESDEVTEWSHLICLKPHLNSHLILSKIVFFFYSLWIFCTKNNPDSRTLPIDAAACGIQAPR